MPGEKNITVNKKARFNYVIEDTFEAGIALLGTEVKSIREGRASIGEGFCDVVKGELYLVDIEIGPYTYGNINNHEPRRRRKLLVHKREIARLQSKVAEKGFSLVPLRMYFKNGRVKVLVGLGKGKKLGDKRETVKKREADREIRRALKNR
jgi:SsrA-binding protein